MLNEFDKDFEIWFATKTKVKEAISFAYHYHGKQKRKYSNMPYISHPIEVATYVWYWGGSEKEVIAALLHDTVEDTGASIEEIRRNFGLDIADMVKYQTALITDSKTPRKKRVEINNHHYSLGNTGSKRGKFADIKSNIKDLYSDDPKFAKTYYAEKWELIHLLYDPKLKMEFFSVRRLLLDLSKIIGLTLRDIPLQDAVTAYTVK